MASTVAAAGAEAVMLGIPPVMWFWRQHMCGRRTRTLSVPQFRVLVIVDREAAASLTDVAAFIGSSLPAASRLVARLVDKGYLGRDEAAGDRRRCSLRLTDRGRTALRAAQAGTRDAIAAELAAGATEDQCKCIVEAMAALDAIFTAARQRAGEAADPGEAACAAVGKRRRRDRAGSPEG